MTPPAPKKDLVVLTADRNAQFALDHERCGREESSWEELEATVELALRTSGWDDRARAIIIDPELEIWLWSDSPHVEKQLGWGTEAPNLRGRLEEQEFWVRRIAKPARPKEALEAVLRKVRKPRSSAIYQALAEKVGLSRCTDGAFEKLRTTLQTWFAVA